MFDINGRILRVCGFSFLLLLSAGCSKSENEVTLSSLLESMTNRVQFAEAPLGVAAMISTYDRTGGNCDWGDFSAVLNGGRIVIADLKGPGSITRIWQTSIPKCQWMFFFDGEATPRLMLPLEKSDPMSTLFGKPISVSESGGFCSYVPIPYKKSLRIELDLKKMVKACRPYYHINYETYPAGTAAQSFNPALSGSELALVASVCDFWNQLPPLFPPGTAVDVERSCVLNPASGEVMLDERGAGMIDTFALRWQGPVDMEAVARNNLLRELWLRIYWDDAAFASVEVPVGDFFCNGLARRRLSSLPIRMTDDWFECGFPMPFRKRARVEIVNYSGVEVKVELKAMIKHQSIPPTLRYFHARWNQSMKTGLPYQVLQAKGAGHFAGCYLISLGMDGSWNILEGDELFTVDGTPVLRGTGLEDYFNGGWYYKGLFERPLHGLIEKGAMRTAQYRFHLTTPVAFKESLICSFEFGAGNQAGGYLSSTAYWYQSTPVAAGRIAIAERKDLRPPLENVAVASMMAELFELERMGYLQECCERSEVFAGLLKGSPYEGIYQARALAYQDVMDGYLCVSNRLAELRRTLGEKHAAVAEIKRLEWFHQSSDNALVSAHSGAQFKLYMDDRHVGSGASPVVLSSFGATSAPGEHTLRVELTPQQGVPASWFSLVLRTHTTNIVSDMAWEYAVSRPEGWPKGDGAESLWKPVAACSEMLPSMAWWQFAPNAVVLTQSGRQLLIPWSGWDQSSNTTYLRRRFTQPQASQTLKSARGAKVSAEGDSVRPADDTSNSAPN